MSDQGEEYNLNESWSFGIRKKTTLRIIAGLLFGGYIVFFPHSSIVFNGNGRELVMMAQMAAQVRVAAEKKATQVKGAAGKLAEAVREVRGRKYKMKDPRDGGTTKYKWEELNKHWEAGDVKCKSVSNSHQNKAGTHPEDCKRALKQKSEERLSNAGYHVVSSSEKIECKCTANEKIINFTLIEWEGQR